MTRKPQPPTRRTIKPGISLTHSEQQVLWLIACDMTNEQIGQQTGRSAETVKTHVRHILIKLNARGRSHAVLRGFEEGYITLALTDEFGKFKAEQHIQPHTVPPPERDEHGHFATACR